MSAHATGDFHIPASEVGNYRRWIANLERKARNAALDEAAEEARPSFEDGYPFDPERILDLKTNPAKDTQ